MLTTNDIGNLFQSMRTAYGPLWKHGQDAMPVWLRSLKTYTARDLQLASNKVLRHFIEYPPNLPQFMEIVSESTPKLEGPEQDNTTELARIYEYCQPESHRNPNGNPHKIKLPESVAQKKMGESVEFYRRRIVDAVTFAKYPKLGPDGRSIGDYT